MDRIQLFDEALELGAIELDALINGNVELAESCCSEREQLMQRAFSLAGIPGKEWRAKLLNMQHLQQQLINNGSELKKQLREELCNSKQEFKRIRGYQQAVRMAT